MPRRYVFVTVFTALLAVAAAFGYLVASPPQEEPTARLLLDNAGGRVVFTHQKHAEDYGVECITCHHDGSQRPCGTCHGVAIDDAFRANHVQAFDNDATACAVCHHKSIEKASWDHEGHIEQYGLVCTDCHHTNLDIEPEPSNCNACHQSKPLGSTPGGRIPDLKSSVHQKCMTCHKMDYFDQGATGCAACHDMRDNRKAAAKGQTDFVTPLDANCATCHTDKKLTELIPDRMNAFHKLCLGCHEEQGSGPYEQDQCNQCHLK